MKIYRLANNITYEFIPLSKRQDDEMKSESFQVYARDNGEIIGGVGGTKYFYNKHPYTGKPLYGGPYINIFHQYTDKRYQRQGIATNLFKKIIEKYPNHKFEFSSLTGSGHALVEALVARGIITLVGPM